jgi:hypothetical protein
MRTHSFGAFALGALATLAGIATAAPPAKVDPESTTPYVWRVFVRFDAHPYFKPDDRRLIVQQVRDALQGGAGQIARVTAEDLDGIPEDRRDALTKAFAKRGWPALDSTEFRTLTGLKTHFLWIAYRNGRFRLESRQHDGSTGLATPSVRVEETIDPQLLGRYAGLMLHREFGPVGTIEKIEKVADAVKVRFRAGELPGLERYVRQGDVFAVAAIVEQPRPPRPRSRPGAGFREVEDEGPPIRNGQPREYLLLRAEGPPLDGACRCEVIAGSAAPPMTLARRIVGFRCMKLPTIEGPIAVRVLDRGGGPLAGAGQITVRAADVDFPSKPDARDTLELRNGLFRTNRPLRNIACIVVVVGTSREARFPVPVLGEGVHTLRLQLNEQDALQAALELDCENLRGRVAETVNAQNQLVAGLTQLIVQGKHRDALDRVAGGISSLTAADQELSAEVNRLRGLPGADGPVPSTILAACVEQLAAVRKALPELQKKAEELKSALAKLDDPQRFELEFRAREINGQIKTHIERGEVPEALDLFNDLVKLLKNEKQQEEVRERKAKLEADWKVRDTDHQKARDYVTGRWRTVTGVAGFKEALVPLKEAADTMTRLDDRLGLRNLISSMELAYSRLKDVLDTLDPNSEVDRPNVAEVKSIAQSLRRIEEDARANVRRIEGTAAPKDQ